MDIKKDMKVMKIHNELNLIVCFFLWTYPYDELIIGLKKIPNDLFFLSII